MGKRAEAEMAEVETSAKKSKKVKALVDTVAEEVEPKVSKKDKKSKTQKPHIEEEVEAEAPKKEKKRKKQEQTEAEAEATPEGAVDADEEKRKRKEEKKKRKQAAAEATAADEEDADFAEAEAEAEAAAAEEDAPKKKPKTDAAADAGTPKSKAVLPPFVHIDDQTVFVGGLPFTLTLDALRKEFSKCGEIQCLKLPGNLKGNRGIGFITYASKEGAKKAIGLDGEDFGGRTLRVNLAGEKRPEKVKEAKEGDDDKAKSNGNRAFQVFVGGLPFQATEAILRKDFGECGEIQDFNMPLNEEGKPKGFIFITYETHEAVGKALAFHDTAYGGRTLTVNKVAGKGKGKDGKEKEKGTGKGKA